MRQGVTQRKAGLREAAKAAKHKSGHGEQRKCTEGQLKAG